MNEFDRFVKHGLREKYYIRYADDFVILKEDSDSLKALIQKIAQLLEQELELSLHPSKVRIKTWVSGVDFLGWVCFPDHKVLRTTTKRRALKRIKKDPNPARVASYLGMFKHGNAKKIARQILAVNFDEDII